MKSKNILAGKYHLCAELFYSPDNHLATITIYLLKLLDKLSNFFPLEYDSLVFKIFFH